MKTEKGALVPAASLCLLIVVVWYLAAIPMNWVITGPKIEKDAAIMSRR